MRILTADRLIIGDGVRVIEQGAIAINEDGKIEAVDTETELTKRFPSATQTRYDGCTLLPGLIDLHVHLGYFWGKPDHSEYNDGLTALLAAANLKEALSLGVTTLRDVTSPNGLCKTLKTAAKKKFIVSPRLFSVNNGIIMTGGHGWHLSGALREADGPWEVRTAVREQVKAGADWIKVMTSDRTPTPEFTQEELDAAVEEAHRLGKKCCVHASLQPAIPMAIKAGFDTIEHGTFMTVEQANQMVVQGLVWVPTMITFFQIAEHFRRLGEQDASNPDIKELMHNGAFFIESEKAYRENFKKLMDTGVKIAAGTDIVLNGYPLTPVAEEIGLMVELGMTPIRAIQTATQTAAEVLEQQHQLGVLAPGYLADVLVVEGNPLRDIRALNQVREVYLEGTSVHTNC